MNETLCPNVEGVTDETTTVVVSAFSTTWVTVLLVPALKSSSPEYSAVMSWLPTESVLVLSAAWSPATVLVPSVVRPSLNVTVPVAPAGTDKDDFSVGPARLEVAGKQYYDLRAETFRRYAIGDAHPAMKDTAELYFCLP